MKEKKDNLNRQYVLKRLLTDLKKHHKYNKKQLERMRPSGLGELYQACLIFEKIKKNGKIKSRN